MPGGEAMWRAPKKYAHLCFRGVGFLPTKTRVPSGWLHRLASRGGPFWEPVGPLGGALGVPRVVLRQPRVSTIGHKGAQRGPKGTEKGCKWKGVPYATFFGPKGSPKGPTRGPKRTPRDPREHRKGKRRGAFTPPR